LDSVSVEGKTLTRISQDDDSESISGTASRNNMAGSALQSRGFKLPVVEMRRNSACEIYSTVDEKKQRQ